MSGQGANSPTAADQETADKFSASWNNVYDPSVYTEAQFLEWIAPWTAADLCGAKVLELGCGSGALLIHSSACRPKELVGVDLGASIEAATRLLAGRAAKIEQADLTQADELQRRFGLFDRVYCIGVIHHLTEPKRGFDSLVAMTRPGGAFHGWVYGHEGNAVVRWLVDPLRRVAHRLPWWLNKYGIALPLSLPFFLYSKTCRILARVFGEHLPLPLFRYGLWIGQRGFRFHHHVAFDQLVTPVTRYLKKAELEAWLADPRLEPGSAYLIFRNGNGWKFGGRRRTG